MNELDHIVWAVPDLDESMDIFYQKTGITPQFGGYHDSQGTKNALVRLGPKSYLELLAPDHKSSISKNRWMGIDLLTVPRITRIAFSTTYIKEKASILNAYNPNLGLITDGHRKTPSGMTINWKMTVPYHSTLIDLAPFFIDWSRSSMHPCQSLTEQPIEIKRIKMTSQHAQNLQKLYSDLDIKGDHIHTGAEEIMIELSTPKGIVTIS